MNNKYPFYRENNALKLTTVITANGEIEYKSNCLKIDGEYYVKNIDLIYLDDKWHLKSILTFDNEKGMYVKSRRGLTFGAVSVRPDGVEYGYFSPNEYKNCTIVVDNTKTMCIDHKLIDNKDFIIEDIASGIYYFRSDLTPNTIRKFSQKRLVINNHHHQYNIIDNQEKFNQSCKLYQNSKFEIDKDIARVGKYIKNTTFGIELETINGTLPEHIMAKYGIIICKDGSIKDENGNYPPEYVTVPLSGAKGLQTLRNVAKEVSKRSDIDFKCSYHLHMGGFEKNRLFLVSLIKLCNKIQNEVFEMFPHYKTDEIRYANKEKNYCKKLPYVVKSYKNGDFNNYINSSYENIYLFLSGGKRFDHVYNFKRKNNPWGNNKWQIDSRYYWVNFTNIVFGKQDTVEFRLHTPTTNPDKIINWLLMCQAIIEYAKTNTMNCISTDVVTFKDVLNIYADKYKTSYAMGLSSNLINYYEARKKQFANDTQNGDYLSAYDLKDDETYSFNVLNINL